MGAYLRPGTVAEATAALADGHWTIVAGGTDFYPARVGRAIVEPVLDVSAVDGLRGIAPAEDGWRFGATTTWTDIIHADLPACFDALKLAAREVGGVQVQNAGTLAGNLCNASPAADGVPALLALDAAVELISAGGTRTVPLGGFITGNRSTVRRPDELVSAVWVPRPLEGARSTFLKLGARKYLVISIVMVSAVLEAEAGAVRRARVAVGSCSAVAKRLAELEAVLSGKSVSLGLADLVTAEHLAPLSPIDDVRAGRAYRLDAALTLVRRAVAELCGQILDREAA